MTMIRSVLLLSLLFAGLPGQAQGAEPAAQTATTPEVVRIWPGAAPGTSDWKIKEINVPFKDKNGKAARMVTNVTDPTLTVIRPAAGKANGTAVIVCPGGGFQILAWDLEGLEVGQWLADRGITAFVLKYRVRPNMTLPDPGEGAPRPKAADFEKAAQALAPYRQIAMADGLQAVRFVRENAARYGVAPGQIGIMGFSAGAMTTMAVVLEGKGPTHPDFAASIYGGMESKTPGADAPPIFVAAAQDDKMVPATKSVEIFQKWYDANLPVELHLYEKGGHGFGLRPQNLPSDGWTAAFEAWLKAHDFIRASAATAP